MTKEAIEKRLRRSGLRLGYDISANQYFVKGKPGWFDNHNQIAKSRWFKNL